MEVSSHALALHRVDGTWFAAAVFTNLGADHLDLHGTVEEYFRAKARLFTPELAAVGVTNVDDAHGRLLLDAATHRDGAVLARRCSATSRSTADRHALHVARAAARRRPRRRRSTWSTRSPRRRRPTCSASTPTTSSPGSPRPAPVPGRFERDRRARRDRADRDRRLRPHARRPRGGHRGGPRASRAGPGDRRVRLRRRPRPRQAAARWARSPPRLADRVVVTSDNPRSEDPGRHHRRRDRRRGGSGPRARSSSSRTARRRSPLALGAGRRRRRRRHRRQGPRDDADDRRPGARRSTTGRSCASCWRPARDRRHDRRRRRRRRCRCSARGS